MKHKEIFAIGSYTEVLDHVPNGCGEGIYIIELDNKTGLISKNLTLSGIKNPSYLTWDQNSSNLYTVSESGENEPVLYKIKVDSNSMEIIDSIVENSSSPCHIAKYKNQIITASYKYGSSTIFDTSDKLNLVKVTPYSGNGPNRVRQDAPHAHQIFLDIKGERYYVTDLGSDKVWIHSLISGELIGEIVTPSGFGPRHLVINNSDIYVLCELVPRLLHYRVSGDYSYTLETTSELYIDDGYSGKNAPAAIKLHPSGKTLYCANRFRDKISIFSIDTPSKKPVLLKEIDSYGNTPRDFTFNKDGSWLIILNQDSSDIITIKVDNKTGIPDNSNINRFELKTPVCAVAIN